MRNQFRALDDDEVDFLDEVREKERAEEMRVRRETEEGLKAFRERQKTGDVASPEGEVGAEEWGTGRKRKRAKGKEVKGVRRRVSEAGQEDNKADAEKKVECEKKRQVSKGVEAEKAERQTEKKVAEAEGTKPDPTKQQKKGVALVAYGSDEDSDDLDSLE